MRIRTRTLVLLLSQGLTQLTTIALGIILAHIISQVELGTFRQVFLAYGIIGGFLMFQIETSLFYFLPKWGIEKGRQVLFQTAMISAAFGIIIGGALFFGAGEIARAVNNPEVEPLLRSFALYPLADRIMTLIPVFMISKDRAVRAGVYSFSAAVLRVAAPVAVFVMGGTVLTAIRSSVLALSAVSAAGFVDMMRLTTCGRWSFDTQLIKQQLSYTWPLWATAIIGTVNSYLDKLLISRFFDPGTYAVYSCGAVELPIVALITTTMASATMPEMVGYADQGDTQAALRLWQEGTRKCSLVIFPCFVFFFMISPDLIVFLYGTKYARAAWPFAIYLLFMPLRVTLFSTLFRAFGNTKAIGSSVALALCMNIAVSTSLTVLGGKSFLSFIGPSIGALIGILTLNASQLFKLSEFLKVRFSKILRWKEMGQLLLWCLMAGIVTYVLPLPKLALASRLGISAIIYVLILTPMLLITRTLNSDERAILLIPLRAVGKTLALWKRH